MKSEAAQFFAAFLLFVCVIGLGVCFIDGNYGYMAAFLVAVIALPFAFKKVGIP